MNELGVVLVPLASAALLAAIPGYRISARLNVLASLISLLFAISLLFDRPASNQYLLIDDLNIVFILLNTFVGFTTSAFSASYIAHELETGRLTARYLRFYHAMFQLMLFGMNLALVANNIGLMWVAVELATLTTVVMVGIYRTHEAIEAAWKYFILGSVGIALALFGTILVYLAARPVHRRGHGRHGLDQPARRRARLRPRLAQHRLHLPAAGLWHQSRPGADARLAAGRARRGPDADLRRAVRPAAERRALRAAAVQDSAGGQSRRHRARPADDRARACCR